MRGDAELSVDAEEKDACEGVGELRGGVAGVDSERESGVRVEGGGVRVGGTGKSRIVSERRRAKRVDGDSVKLSGSLDFTVCSWNVGRASGISRVRGIFDELYDRDGTRGLGRCRRRGLVTAWGSSSSARSPSSSSDTDGRSLGGAD